MAEREPHDCMYSRIYLDVQGVLDRALGSEESDGAGEGLAADVALLAQRYADLRAAVLKDAASPSYWGRRIAEIEAEELRDISDEAFTAAYLAQQDGAR